MLINKNIVLAVSAGLLLGAGSCRKFMDVNDNPNVAKVAKVEQLLPAAQLYVGSAVGVDLQISGSIWAQYWTQSPSGTQYIPFDNYTPGQDHFATAWKNLYAGASNFYQLYNVADSQYKKQYKAISMLMRAYTFQVIADGWGNAPFTQALRAQTNAGGYVNPAYDSQRVIYTGVLAYIDSALKLVNPGDGSRPGTDDLIYGGDMNRWRKFGNTLKLKALLRISAIDPSRVQKLADTFFMSNPDFLGMGDDAKINYGYSSTNQNPLYAELSAKNFGGVQNLAGSKTCIDSMNANSDPRVDLFYQSTITGLRAGIVQGAYNVPTEWGTYSIPSPVLGADAQNGSSANASVNLMTSAESYFLQAEAAVRGWWNGGADATLFNQGVAASFNSYGSQIIATLGVSPNAAAAAYLGGGGYWTVYPTGGTADEKLRHILTQKWFAMCGNQGFEAWTEWRRTGYPDFLAIPLNSQLGTQHPVRFLYPTIETATNSNFPSSGLLPITEKVWWDVF